MRTGHRDGMPALCPVSPASTETTLALLAFGGASGTASAPAPDPGAAAFEQAFLTNTIDHHFMAVEMGRMCVEKGTRRKLPTCATGTAPTRTR